MCGGKHFEHLTLGKKLRTYCGDKHFDTTPLGLNLDQIFKGHPGHGLSDPAVTDIFGWPSIDLAKDKT